MEPGSEQRGERIGRQGDLHFRRPLHDNVRPGRGLLCRRDEGPGWRLLWSQRLHRSVVRWFISGLLRLQQTGDLLEPGEGQISGLAQILLAQLLTRASIGIPVALAPLHGFQTCRAGALLAVKGKGGELGQPGKPSRAVWD